MNDVPEEHEDEFNRWYNEEHLPERAAAPGFLSARRFIAIEGAPRYLAMYELDNVDVLNTEPYLTMNQTTPWTTRIRTLRSFHARNIYEEITPLHLQG
ncbi:hypothetical protein [Subtercola sp. YIM 133946]|uniref:hypothetical protein n=1 Tax=Subtercola sp. YIM 133946 TaxID=3118909 RepID=UPI002F92196E